MFTLEPPATHPPIGTKAGCFCLPLGPTGSALSHDPLFSGPGYLPPTLPFQSPQSLKKLPELSQPGHFIALPQCPSSRSSILPFQRSSLCLVSDPLLLVMKPNSPRTFQLKHHFILRPCPRPAPGLPRCASSTHASPRPRTDSVWGSK